MDSTLQTVKNCILGVKMAIEGTVTWMMANGARNTCLGQLSPFPRRSLRGLYPQGTVAKGKQSTSDRTCVLNAQASTLEDGTRACRLWARPPEAFPCH